MSVSVIRYSAVCLMAGSFLSSSAYADYNCTKSPDCASLGYTMSADDCVEGAVKVACQTDLSKFFCKKKTPEAPLPILYGDGTVDKKILADKTPIGIVFDEENKLALALTNVDSNGSAGSSTMHWSSSHCDVPDLTNCVYNHNNPLVDNCDVDGRANTNAILATNGGCSGTTYAANGANLYAPSGCNGAFCQKGRWFLPSTRDLAKIYANKSEINASLSLLNGVEAKTLKESYYYSSNEYSAGIAWSFDMDNGNLSGSNKNYDPSGYENYIRPVVKY